jgi:cytochrome c553
LSLVVRAAAVLLGAACWTGEAAPVLAAGSSAAGSAAGEAAVPPRAAACAACHGADGRSNLALSPTLAAQPRVFLENTLILIREGLRPVAAMTGLLHGVDDAEIVALAEHFSRQPIRPESTPRDEATFERGRSLAARALCGTCHLPNYAGQQQMPRLAGQREDYLVHSMREFRDNRAQGRDTQMNGVLRGFSDRDLGDLAHYFAQLR